MTRDAPILSKDVVEFDGNRQLVAIKRVLPAKPLIS